jgi:hypothetical protein
VDRVRVVQEYGSRYVLAQVRVLCCDCTEHGVEEVEAEASRSLVVVVLEMGLENISRAQETALDHRLCTETMGRATRLANVTGMVQGTPHANVLGIVHVGLAKVLEIDLNIAHAGLEKRHGSTPGSWMVEQEMLRVIWLASSRSVSETQLAS